jgi:hypothetical protein
VAGKIPAAGEKTPAESALKVGKKANLPANT